MDTELEHTSIIGKKISSFARAVMEIFKFLSGKVAIGPPC